MLDVVSIDSSRFYLISVLLLKQFERVSGVYRVGSILGLATSLIKGFKIIDYKSI